LCGTGAIIKNSASTLAPDSPKKVRAFGSGSSYGSKAPVKTMFRPFQQLS